MADDDRTDDEPVGKEPRDVERRPGWEDLDEDDRRPEPEKKRGFLDRLTDVGRVPGGQPPG
jgi:hypothetical protein